MANKNNKNNSGNNSAVETQESKKKKRSGRVIKTAIVCTALGLSVSAIAGLSVALHYSNRTVRTHESYQRQMDAVYFRAYYDLIDGANDMGVTLRKLGASASPSMQQSLLYEVWSAASIAEANLGMFESESDGIIKAQKFVNQLGDYSRALALRVADGIPLTADEKARLVKLGAVADAYQRALNEIKGSVDSGKMFVGDGGALEDIETAFSEFAEPSFAYPEMIYDGPFSDALEHRESVALSGDEVSPEEGAALISEYFDGRTVSEIEFIGEGSGDIPTLNYSIKVDGSPAFVQLGKKGGRLVSFNAQAEDNNKDDEEEVEETVHQDAGPTCQENAIRFASKLGFKDMHVVWSSSADGMCVVNLAPIENGVILYPDLIKVKLRERDSRVIGLDATHYAFNHRARKLPTPNISMADAKSKLAIPAVSDGRLALIPLRGTREVLTYEFECEQNGTYFVYIDALSGAEANILFVIDDSPSMGSRTI